MFLYQNILKELIPGISSWDNLKQKISQYNTSQSETTEKDTRAGKIFEVFTKLYFLFSPTEKDNFKHVWLFDEIPDEIRIKLNLGNQDYGVDLVLQDHEDLLFVVQCKYKNDESKTLNWSADKIANLFAHCSKADGFIVFSNVTDLDTVSRTRHQNFTFYGISNLNEMEDEDFQIMSEYLNGEKIQQRKPYSPLPHQKDAIQACIQGFIEEKQSRGQLILPCGAGKTFTALWIKEVLKSKKTLVLVPSLALLRQIKNEWSKQKKDQYQYLCVCSEDDIDKDTEDSWITHTYEIGTKVTTDPEDIQKFLTESGKRQEDTVIFSTYHSLVVVADAIQGMDFSFDFTFCDEAHKTAGIRKSRFNLVHDNARIPSKYRLYATATPRIINASARKKLEDDFEYVYDMNDPNIFGKELYRMTFKHAIEQDILVDYKIIAIGVTDDEIQAHIEQRTWIDDDISLDDLANNYALKRVMDKYDTNHGLTFHSRIKYAQEFAERHRKLFSDTTEGDSIKTYAVSGKQSTNQRNRILTDFKNAPKAVISNARCLTEGVDVPAIDVVYFCDPRNSKIDIVQAVGRALRKKEGKKLGYIVVPIYHSRHDEVENSISQGSFNHLLQVIRSLCDQDERLQDDINHIAFGKGERKFGKIDIISQAFGERENIILLDGFEEKLKNSLFDQIISRSTDSWNLHFLELKEYLSIHDQEYPAKEENKSLYGWITSQRLQKNKGTLEKEKEEKLNAIGFVWKGADWDISFQKFKEYLDEHNQEYPEKNDDAFLYNWIASQKTQRNKGTLERKREEKLNTIGFVWNLQKDWNIRFEELKEYRNKTSNKWPAYNRKKSKSDSSLLGVWCQQIRQSYKQNTLDPDLFEKLCDLGFPFEGHKDKWMMRYQTIQNLLKNNPDITVNELGATNYNWIQNNRKKFTENTLSESEKQKFESLNIDSYTVFLSKEDQWESMFFDVKKWINENNKFPTPHTQKLYANWLQTQRIKYKNKTLTEDQIQKVESLGFSLNPVGFKDKWMEQFESLKQFMEINHREPVQSKKEEFSLNNWCQAQRNKQRGTYNGGNCTQLEGWQVELLESIGFRMEKMRIPNEN